MTRAPPVPLLALHAHIAKAAPRIAAGMLAVVIGMHSGRRVGRGALVYGHVYALRRVAPPSQRGRPSSRKGAMFFATIAGRGPVRLSPPSGHSSTAFAACQASSALPLCGASPLLPIIGGLSARSSSPMLTIAMPSGRSSRRRGRWNKKAPRHGEARGDKVDKCRRKLRGGVSLPIIWLSIVFGKVWFRDSGPVGEKSLSTRRPLMAGPVRSAWHASASLALHGIVSSSPPTVLDIGTPIRKTPKASPLAAFSCSAETAVSAFRYIRPTVLMHGNKDRV